MQAFCPVGDAQKFTLFTVDFTSELDANHAEAM
jgi:hypothetical protein